MNENASATLTRNHQHEEENLIAGYADLAIFLTERGFKISRRTLENLCLQGCGPPIHGRWGSRNTFLSDKALEWARNRLSLKSTPPAPLTREEDDLPQF